MANRLQKSVIYTYVPGTAGSPAFEGQPYIPAYSGYDLVYVCDSTPVTNQPYVYTDEFGVVRIGNSPGLNRGTVWPNDYRCYYKRFYVYHPEQPYIPPTPAVPYTAAHWRRDLNAGWNSGGRSIDAIGLTETFRFKVSPKPGGVAVGFSAADIESGLTELSHAFVIIGTTAYIYEYGVPKMTAGTVTGGETYYIRFQQPYVSYYIDTTPIYTSTNLILSTTTYVDTSLYLGDDYVYDPAFVADAGAALTFEELTLSSFGHKQGESALTTYGGATLSFELWELIGEGLDVVVTGKMEPMSVVSYGHKTGQTAATSFGTGAISTVAMTLNSYGAAQILLPNGASGYMWTEPLVSAGVGRIGDGANLSNTLGMLALGHKTGQSALARYGQAIMESEAMLMQASAFEGNFHASVWSFGAIDVAALMSTSTIFAVVMTSSATASSTITVAFFDSASLTSTATVTDALTALANFVVTMTSTATVTSIPPVTDQPVEVWVVNAENSGSTMYESYDFTDYAMIGEEYYGVKSDGVYLLEGATDQSAAVRASISFGKRDFHTPKMKRLANAYFGISSSGRMFVRVTANGADYVYATRTSSTDMKLQRADLGKGLRANYFELELYNENGADFELDTVEFVPAVIERRI